MKLTPNFLCYFVHLNKRFQHDDYKESASSISMFIFLLKLSNSSECNVRNDGIAHMQTYHSVDMNTVISLVDSPLRYFRITSFPE